MQMKVKKVKILKNVVNCLKRMENWYFIEKSTVNHSFGRFLFLKCLIQDLIPLYVFKMCIQDNFETHNTLLEGN